MLSSLLVFGAPVSAENPNTIEFVIPIDMGSRVMGPTDNWEVKWLGAPRDVTLPYDGAPLTKSLDGTIKLQSLIDKKGEAIWSYDLDPSGTFGAGTAVIYFETMYDNFESLRTVGTAHWVFTFFEDGDEWEGTITCSRLVKYEIIGWRFSFPTGPYSSLVNREPILGHWGMLEGTGDFENFHFKTNDAGWAGSGSVGGTGFFTPN